MATSSNAARTTSRLYPAASASSTVEGKGEAPMVIVELRPIMTATNSKKTLRIVISKKRTLPRMVPETQTPLTKRTSGS